MPALIVFIVVPVLEMYLLIEVGGLIGAWPTIALVLLTAVVGVTLLRQQGIATLARGVSRMNAGELPAEELFEGLFLAIGGALLLTPGFLTDAFGFACLLPASRRAMARALIRRGIVQGTMSVHGVYRGPGGTHVIDGEVVRETEQRPPLDN